MRYQDITGSFLWSATFLSILTVAVSASYQHNQYDPSGKSIMKAWHCHGRSQKDLVDRLRQAKIVKSPAVQRVMELVDRKYYVGEHLDQSTNPYMDSPMGIGKSQTISAPHMHAHVLEEILPVICRNAGTEERPAKLLDVGCGSGYLTACLGRWFHVGSRDDEASNILPFQGKVFGMDIHPELVEFTRLNIQKNDCDLLESNTIKLKHGNGWLGWPEEAPFDAIHVGAAAATFPMQLALQLVLHGILVVPVGHQGGNQILLKVERVAQSSVDRFSWEDYHVTQLLGVRYVPLVQRPE